MERSVDVGGVFLSSFYSNNCPPTNVRLITSLHEITAEGIRERYLRNSADLVPDHLLLDPLGDVITPPFSALTPGIVE